MLIYLRFFSSSSFNEFYPPHHHLLKLSPINSCCFRKWDNENPDQIKKPDHLISNFGFPRLVLSYGPTRPWWIMLTGPLMNPMEISMSMEFVSKCGLTMITILAIGTIMNVTTYYPTSAKAEHLQVTNLKKVPFIAILPKNLINYSTQQYQQPCRISIQNCSLKWR